MGKLVLEIELMLKLISYSELERNPKAREIVQRIKLLITELKGDQNQHGVIKHINPKMLLEN